jgi:hypothetical protein
MKKRRVAILTNFSSYLRSYSPLIIVSEQIRMLNNAGYEPVVIVTESFEAPEDSIFNEVILERIPNVSVSIEAKQDISFETDIAFLKSTLEGILKDIDVILTHDLVFLPDYVKHRLACIAIAEERPELRWLHWVHSATSPGSLIEERRNFEDKYKELLGKKFPNSFIVYPNSADIPRVARNFGYEEDEVFVVPHSTDYLDYNKFEPLTRKLVSEKDLLSRDVIIVYPLRMDRGKQPHVLVDIAYALKGVGLTVAVIYADFQSTGGDKVEYREEIKRKAEDLNISEDIIFMSEFDIDSQMDSSRQVVSDLFELSNFFILPSMSETYSLVAQEAMLKGNFCILNHDFPPMRSIYGDKAIYKQFSGNVGFDGMDGNITTTHSNPEGYYHDIANYIKYVLENNKVVKGRTWVRKERNPDVVFRNHIEPLLYVGEEK